jgi:hypothetical protein
MHDDPAIKVEMQDASVLRNYAKYAQTIRDLQNYLRGFVAGGGKLDLPMDGMDEALTMAYMALMQDGRQYAEHASKRRRKR